LSKRIYGAWAKSSPDGPKVMQKATEEKLCNEASAGKKVSSGMISATFPNHGINILPAPSIVNYSHPAPYRVHEKQWNRQFFQVSILFLVCLLVFKPEVLVDAEHSETI
jgi:hypothetical protein